MNKFYIVYPNGDRSAPFDNYADAKGEANMAVVRLGAVAIVWIRSDGTPDAYIVQ